MVPKDAESLRLVALAVPGLSPVVQDGKSHIPGSRVEGKMRKEKGCVHAPKTEENIKFLTMIISK